MKNTENATVHKCIMLSVCEFENILLQHLGENDYTKIILDGNDKKNYQAVYDMLTDYFDVTKIKEIGRTKNNCVYILIDETPETSDNAIDEINDLIDNSIWSVITCLIEGKEQKISDAIIDAISALSYNKPVMQDKSYKFVCNMIDSIKTHAKNVLSKTALINKRVDDWNMEIIGEVCDVIEREMKLHDIPVCHPYFIHQDGTTPCYKTCDCENEYCALKTQKEECSENNYDGDVPADTITGYVGQVLEECDIDNKACTLLTELYNIAVAKL